MLRADTGNYNRFLTSLGLALLAAALVIPYFFFHSIDVLQIPRQTLMTLTPTAKDALEGRQHAIVILEPLVVGGSILLALSGIVLLLCGGRRLRNAQDSEEEESELRKTRTRAEIRQLSPERLADKQDQEAREAAAGTPKPTEKESPRNLGDVRYRELRAAIGRIEERIAAELGRQDFGTHEFLPNVRITSSQFSGALELDGLFEAIDQSTRKDVVLGVKVAPRSYSRPLAQQTANALLAEVAKYEAIIERPATGWLVVVIPETEEPIEDLAQMRSRFTEAVSPAAAITVVREKDLSTLPAEFRQLALSEQVLET
jgi:hypothetical protein